MKKGLQMTLIVFGYFLLPNIYAQTGADCSVLKIKIDKAFTESKTIRIGYSSRNRYTYLDYEKDASANTHFVYRNTGKESKRLALINIKDKTFAAQTEGEWKDKMPSNFNAKAWIDSCMDASKIFSKPFQSCAFSRDVKITGTPYSILIVAIENDSFYVWFNKTTDKLEKIVGEHKQKDLNLEWYFDIPFEITSPRSNMKDANYFTFNVFPPSFNWNEDIDGTEPVFNIPDKLPEFEGGLSEMFKMLSSNIKYPKIAQKNGIEGTVYIGFVVEKDGSVDNCKLKRGIQKDCNEEAMRVVKLLSGKWIAGNHKGRKVRVAYTLPIKFKLE